jgi:hypothetical protein
MESVTGTKWRASRSITDDRPDPHPPRTHASREAHAEPQEPHRRGPREPRGVTRPTPVRRRAAGPLEWARTPATTRGPSAWAAVPTGATDWPPPASLPTGPAGPGPQAHDESAGAATRQSVLVRAVIASYTQPTRSKFPIP